MSTDTREALAALPLTLQFSADYLRAYMEGELDEARRHLEKLIAALATQPAQPSAHGEAVALRKDADRLAIFEDWLSDRAGPLLHIDDVRAALAATKEQQA